MKQWHLIIDVEKCENCNNCFLACKDEFCGNDWPGYSCAQPLHGHRWMNIQRKERGRFPFIDVAYLPSPCMHCGDPACMRRARHGAVYKRPDGIVLIDPEKGRGQRQLLEVCPYGAIFWNAEKNLPQKCTLCAHLLDEGWQAPRCVQVCPTGALSIMRLDAPQLERVVTAQELEMIGGRGNPTRPSVYYKNLYRYTKCFITGTVAMKRDGLTDCVPGAVVRLVKDGRLRAETRTDVFGDFKFDRLPGSSSAYLLEISGPDGHQEEIQVDLGKSISTGTIWL